MPTPPKPKSPASKPPWVLHFEISPDLVSTPDGRRFRKATALARRGDSAYLAELEVSDLKEDIARFFEQARAYFFQVETQGQPAFPKLTDPTPPLTKQPPAVTADPATADPESDSAAEYEIEFHPADAPAPADQSRLL